MYVIICVGIQRMSICKMLTSVVSLLDAQSEGRNKRQTVLLSATLSPQVERLAGLTLNDPVRLDAADDGHTDKQLVIPQSLAQHYIVTPAKLRLVTLAAFIHWKCQVCKTIPFSLLIVLITVVLCSILFLKFQLCPFLSKWNRKHSIYDYFYMLSTRIHFKIHPSFIVHGG